MQEVLLPNAGQLRFFLCRLYCSYQALVVSLTSGFCSFFSGTEAVQYFSCTMVLKPTDQIIFTKPFKKRQLKFTG